MSRSREEDKRKSAPWSQNNFASGMIKYAPHQDIPQSALAGLRNAIAYPTEIQPRPASKIHATLTPPVLQDDNGNDRSGYTAYKSGDIIYSLSGEIFDADDVSHYWVWPGSDYDYHDEIAEFLDAERVRVTASTDSDRESTSGCWMHAKNNLNEFHQSVRRHVHQIGRRVYTNTWDMTAANRQEAYCVSYERPLNAISDWAAMDDMGAIGNSGGIFALDFESLSTHTIFKRNTSVPAQLIWSVGRSRTRKHRYDYTYSMARLSGTGIRNRSTAGVKIVQETGTCLLNPNTSPNRDYGTRWTDSEIDRGTKIYGVLTGAEIANASLDVPGVWATVDDGTMKVTIDDETYQLWIDFTDAETMADVAALIQLALQQYWPFAVCVFYLNTLIIYSGQDGSTISGVTSGTGGTDISGAGYTNLANGTVENGVIYASPHTVERVYVPKVGTAPTEPEWHYTHYVIYRTTDIGPDGVEPRMADDGTELPPLEFVYCLEIRVSGAFWAYKDNDGYIHAVIGEFEKADEGTAFRWEDGEVDTLGTYINASTMLVDLGGDYYYTNAKPLQAAAIGGGIVIRATQDGRRVTIPDEAIGSFRFSISDERKTIHWADSTYSIITKYLAPRIVQVHNTAERQTQGITFDATHRNFTDTVNDADLRGREDELHVGLLQHRYYTAMRNCTLLRVVPGFMIGARQNESDIYYCQLGVSRKYLAGFHLASRQKIDRIEDGIWALNSQIPNKAVVFCVQSTWGIPTNLGRVVSLPSINQTYGVLQTDIIDANIGCQDRGSIRQVARGLLQLRCTDNSVRQLDGFQYGEDMTVLRDTGQDAIKTKIKSWWQQTASAFKDSIGYVLWGKPKG